MPVWKHVFVKALLCESIGVPYVGRLLLESLSYVAVAAKLLGFCSILQLAPVHCMAWCNISSLHGALPSSNFCSSAKLTSANRMIVARYGIISANCAVMFTALWTKKNCTLDIECSQFLETKNYHLHSMCSILVRRIVLAKFATIIGKPHGMRSILKLTSVNWMLLLQLSWSYHLQIAQRGMVFAACCG